jgi:hypothetical protein
MNQNEHPEPQFQGKRKSKERQDNFLALQPEKEMIRFIKE